MCIFFFFFLLTVNQPHTTNKVDIDANLEDELPLPVVQPCHAARGGVAQEYSLAEPIVAWRTISGSESPVHKRVGPARCLEEWDVLNIILQFRGI